MSWGKHFVRAGITYMLAVFGIAGFYFDMRTGRVIKSRVLCYYCRFFNLFVLAIVAMTTDTHWIKTPLNLTQYKLMTFLIFTFPATMLICNVSCIFYSQICQHRIFTIVEELLKMERFNFNYRVRPVQQQHLQWLFWIRLFLLLPRLGIFVIRAFMRDKGFLFYITSLLTRLMRCAFYYLVFDLIWQICYSFLRLQLYIEELLFDIMPMTVKIQRMQAAQRAYYTLIHLVDELCGIFKYPLAFYIIHLIYYYGLSGYTLIQLLFGQNTVMFNRKTDFMQIFSSVLEATEFYTLSSIAHMASTLHESTFFILRYPYPNEHLLERSNDWLSLQLTWRNKNIHIFGVLDINHQMFFIILNSIILHLIYMVQSDYNFLQI